MGAWQMRSCHREDEDDAERYFSFDSTLTLNQNIMQWQTEHGRLHTCRVIYERITTPPSSTTQVDSSKFKSKTSGENQQSATSAASVHMLNSFAMGADTLHTTLGIHDMSEEERTLLSMGRHYH
jgi:hypothetical protein